jgi:uncharacterized protein YdeI (BOF family)
MRHPQNRRMNAAACVGLAFLSISVGPEAQQAQEPSQQRGAEAQREQREQREQQAQDGRAQPTRDPQTQDQRAQQTQDQQTQDPQAQDQQAQTGQRQEEEQLARADANPYAVPDDTFISLSGTVGSVTRDAFTLNFNDGAITVEMDDGDRDADGYLLTQGDAVTVYGLIDDDFFEARTIEASSVYVENLGTYFYASAVDEEDRGFVTLYAPLDPSTVVLQGSVTEIDDEEFVIDVGSRQVTVEVEEMAYNPLDDEGYQRVDIGDVVSVTGEVDDDFFEGREVEAESVTTIHNFN